MTEEEKKILADLYHLCPTCGRAVPPKDCKDATAWLIRNDNIFKRAYDLGRQREMHHKDRTYSFEDDWNY